MRNRLLGIIFVVLLSCSARAQLRAGATRVEITPKTHELLWGFEDRKDPATGTLDPLYARILVLEAVGKRLALVSVDLGRTFGEPSLDHLKETVAKSSGISCLLVSATHTHGAPVIKDDDRNPPEWERRALDGIAAGIKSAADHLQEARIGAGTGSVFIGHNRLRVNDDGTANWFEQNQTRVPTSPVDPTVTVLRIDDRNGSPLAILTNYACHPVIFGSDNTQYTADYPGVANALVERAFGGSVQSFFIQGADGDINPYYAVTPIEEDAVKWRDWTGEQLGREVVRIAKGVQTANESSASIDFREETLHFKGRWDPEQLRAAILKTSGAKGVEQSEARSAIDARLTAVLIDKQIAILAVPGEPFVEFQESWRAHCPASTAFFFGYTNGYHGYFPTIAAASRGGYGAASSSTWIELGAGERMVDWALTQIYSMMGKYSSLPDDLPKDAGGKN